MTAPDRIWISKCGKALVTDQKRWADDVEYIRADLVAAPAPAAMTPEVAAWQPIETAPKDVHILIAHHPTNRWRGAIRIGFFHSDYNGHKGVITEDGRAGWVINPAPTHWMPLPAAPDAALRAGGQS